MTKAATYRLDVSLLVAGVVFALLVSMVPHLIMWACWGEMRARDAIGEEVDTTSVMHVRLVQLCNRTP